jgi:MFS family permease
VADAALAPARPAADAARDDGRDREGIGTFHAFRYRDFRWLWLGNTFSSGAQWVQQTTVGWVAYELTGSGAVLGAINSLRHLPPLFAAPVAGVTADRYSRNAVVAVTQGLLFLNAAMIAMALMLDALQVWHLFAFTIVAGTLNAFNQPARQTMVFDVVPRAAASNAIALNSLAGNATRTLGPMVGGGLILLLGPANNFLVQACAYLGVVITVFAIRRFPPRLEGGRKRSFIRDMADGYDWALHNPQARLLVLMMALYPGFIIPVHSALMPIFAKDVFHSDAGGLGLLLSALGVGGLCGSFLAARVTDDRRGLLQLLALFTVSGFLALYGLAGGLTENLWLGIFLLVLSGTGGALFNTINQTVLQLLAPDRMRGRVTGILTVQPVFSSAGILIAGFAAEAFGPIAVAIASGSIMFGIGLLILVFSPRMRRLRLSTLAEERELRV